MLAILGDVAFPSQNPEDYAKLGSECPWYQERKASGSVVSCQFPSTTFLVGAAAVAVLLIVVTR